MSAIAGMYQYEGNPSAFDEWTHLMLSLRQYPADDIQVWHYNSISLGCHAQWITPESVGELLPYYDSTMQLAITADVILDNREELFSLLNVYDRRMTDSQLILLAYRKWGERAPEYLHGDFAFVIWDEREQKCFGARDFSGARTLYYCANQERFAFCTTMEPLMHLSGVTRRLNEQWLAQFLVISGFVDVADTAVTVYSDIMQLPPSHYMTVTKQGITLKQYCSVHPTDTLKLKSNEEYVEAFQVVFQEAINARLRTHRQVGAQLSGGLDSGSIVGFAKKPLVEQNKTLHTFSAIPLASFQDFTAKMYQADERPFIRLTVEHVGNIHEHYLDFPTRDSYSEIDDFLDVMETPYKFFENSFWLKGIFEHAQEQDIGVLLNGGRGNLTVSWGTALDYYATLMKQGRWIKLLQELEQYSVRTGGSRFRHLPTISKKAFPILQRIGKPQAPSYVLPSIIHPAFARKTKVHDRLLEYGLDMTGWNDQEDIFTQRRRHFQELFHWNAGNTLSTKLSLRYSLWKRDPTNDLRVVRFCLSLPEGQYVQNGMDRALIRRSTANVLPDAVRLNQRIRGVQGVDWVLRMQPRWAEFIEELQQLVRDPMAKEYLDTSVLQHAIDRAKAGVQPDFVHDPNSKILMRSLIVYRFLKRVG